MHRENVALIALLSICSFSLPVKGASKTEARSANGLIEQKLRQDCRYHNTLHIATHKVSAKSITKLDMSSDEPPTKKQRTIGPTLPPANLDQKPRQSPSNSSSDSSDDDDFGPALPSASAKQSSPDGASTIHVDPEVPAAQTKRDEWMTMAPESGDWSSRVDPTKLKSRGFNSGKGAKGPTVKTGGDSSWHETPAEKQARLAREVLGIKEIKAGPQPKAEDQIAVEKSKKMKDAIEKSRGSTLYNEHQKSNPREKEDDPSARAFDREKDIAGGMKINTTQRKELMKNASDFGSRFSSAKFL